MNASGKAATHRCLLTSAILHLSIEHRLDIALVYIILINAFGICCRDSCLRGRAALFGAAPDARANSSALAAFQQAFPPELLQDTGESRQWEGPFFVPAAGTLDGWLLDHWFDGTAQYDALFMQNFSSTTEVQVQPMAAPVAPFSCSTPSTHWIMTICSPMAA